MVVRYRRLKTKWALTAFYQVLVFLFMLVLNGAIFYLLITHPKESLSKLSDDPWAIGGIVLFVIILILTFNDLILNLVITYYPETGNLLIMRGHYVVFVGKATEADTSLPGSSAYYFSFEDFRRLRRSLPFMSLLQGLVATRQKLTIMFPVYLREEND